MGFSDMFFLLVEVLKRESKPPNGSWADWLLCGWAL
jgi:hypothetical protein